MTQQQRNKIAKALAHLRIALTEANPQKIADGNLYFDIAINDCVASVDGEEFDITWEVDEILRSEVEGSVRLECNNGMVSPE